VTQHDIEVEVRDDLVAVVEICRPPHNYFDVALVRVIADAYADLDARRDVRAIVLASEGKNFCAGADFSNPTTTSGTTEESLDVARTLYRNAARLFAVETPVVAAVQGAAIGGGLGLALSADFRVAGDTTRFAANFSRIGLYPGFGITLTLPRIVGEQRAIDMLLTGRFVDGPEARTIGLSDRLVADAQVRDAAIALALELAGAAPLSVQKIRAAVRRDLVTRVAETTEHELERQGSVLTSADFAEGIAAATQRRRPQFTGR
jgi:enoyl-CoA hydratase/carnithine racemase